MGVLIVEERVRDGSYRLIDDWTMEVNGEVVRVLGPQY